MAFTTRSRPCGYQSSSAEAELSYLILHDPDLCRVRRERLVETSRRICLKHDVALFARVLDNLGEDQKFSFNVISAAPQGIIQSALEGMVAAGSHLRHAFAEKS